MFEPQLCNLKILNGTSGVTVFENHKDLPFFLGFGSVAASHCSGKTKHLQKIWSMTRCLYVLSMFTDHAAP